MPGNWEQITFRVKADHPNWGAGRVHKDIEAYAKKNRIDGVPGERTVGRILEGWKEKSDEEKAQYRTFRWPESMEGGNLEWGASESALELLAYSHRLGAGRPTNRLVEWFWRVSQAAPNEPIQRRLAFTCDIATHQLQGQKIPEGLEWRIAYDLAKAKGSVASGSYEAAVMDPDNPIPEYSPAPSFPPRNTQGELDPATRQNLDFAYAILWGSLGISYEADTSNEPKDLDYYLELFNQGPEGS